MDVQEKVRLEIGGLVLEGLDSRVVAAALTAELVRLVRRRGALCAGLGDRAEAAADNRFGDMVGD
jgi:hypothetical protein